MHLTGSDLEILVSFRARRPDLEILRLLLNYEALLDVDSLSIVKNSISISSPTPNVLQVESVARLGSGTTGVFQVQALTRKRSRLISGYFCGAALDRLQG